MDYNKYGWQGPPHTLHSIIQETDEHIVTFTIKVYSKDNIDIEDLVVTEKPKVHNWAPKKRSRDKMTDEDIIREEQMPYRQAEQ